MNEIFADFTYESEEFDINIAKSVDSFITSICMYIENFENNSYTTESEDDSIITAIKKFFANIISTMKNFLSEIQVEVSSKVRASQTDHKLHELYKKLKEKKEQGSTKVSVMDVWTIEDYYLKAVNEMKDIAKRFSKMKYKRVSEIDKDITEFNKLYEKWDTKLKVISEKKITVDIDKMINFVEDEISNRSKIMDSINDCITLLDHMEKDCELITTREEILGPDIIPKHLSLMRRITTSISAFIKKWTVKIISTVVFIIG